MSRNERGAAAVEFALVLPLLVALLAGIAEFGRAYHLQTALSQSAREGVRVMALSNDAAAARAAARSAAPTLVLGDADITITTASPAGSPAGTCSVAAPATLPPQATVTIRYATPFMSGLFGTTLRLQGTGVMRCGG